MKCLQRHCLYQNKELKKQLEVSMTLEKEGEEYWKTVAFGTHSLLQKHMKLMEQLLRFMESWTLRFLLGNYGEAIVKNLVIHL